VSIVNNSQHCIIYILCGIWIYPEDTFQIGIMIKTNLDNFSVVLYRPHYSENINVRGTINVLEAARRSGVERIVYGSTTWVYGDVTEKYVDEQTRLSPPAHLYTATKIVSEYYCQCYGGLYDLPYTILRYGIPYGPRARDGAVIPIFVHKAMNGEPLTIAGDGSQFRQFVYVEDLAEGNVLALKSIAANKIYNQDSAMHRQEVLGDAQDSYYDYNTHNYKDMAGNVLQDTKLGGLYQSPIPSFSLEAL